MRIATLTGILDHRNANGGESSGPIPAAKPWDVYSVSKDFARSGGAESQDDREGRRFLQAHRPAG